jgi:hypothetical protein
VITTLLKRSKAFSYVLVLALVVPAAGQQTGSPAPATGQPAAASAPAFTSEQLEQIAAPVALYPDPLLAQVLMASTYPLEIVQAARFVKDNPSLKGDQLNEKLKDQNWDDSVKSLVSFPQVLSLMDGKLDWTQQLGDATIGQEKELMDAIQRLRARAQAQGNLKNTQEQTVTVEPAPPAAPGQATPAQQTIVIQPSNPDVVYVPSYNPTVVYGSWPYPAYPPASPYPPGYAFGTALLSFGVGMAVGGALWGNCNWGGGNVDVNVNRNENFSRNVNRSNVAADRSQRVQQGQRGGRSEFKHNPENRKGVQYRDQGTQQRYNRAADQRGVQSREQFRGRAEQGRQDLGRGGGQQFGGAQGGARAQPRGGGQQFGGAQGGARQQPRGGGGQQFGGGGGGGRGGSAFQGAGSGGNARNFSNRGQSSRQSMSAGGARSGGSRPSGSAGGGRSGGGGASRGGGGGSRGGGGRR